MKLSDGVVIAAQGIGYMPGASGGPRKGKRGARPFDLSLEIAYLSIGCNATQSYSASVNLYGAIGRSLRFGSSQDQNAPAATLLCAQCRSARLLVKGSAPNRQSVRNGQRGPHALDGVPRGALGGGRDVRDQSNDKKTRGKDT